MTLSSTPKALLTASVTSLTNADWRRSSSSMGRCLMLMWGMLISSSAVHGRYEGRSEGRFDSRPEGRFDSRPEGKSEGSPAGRSEGRPECGSEGRPECRPECGPEGSEGSEGRPGGTPGGTRGRAGVLGLGDGEGRDGEELLLGVGPIGLGACTR